MRTAITTLTLSALLVACGGGGGGTGPQTQAPPTGGGATTLTAQATPASNVCQAPAGSTSCGIRFALATSGATSARLEGQGGRVIPVTPNQSLEVEVDLTVGQGDAFQFVAVGPTGEVFRTPAMRVQADCVAGTFPNGTGTPRCEARLQYEQVIVGNPSLLPYFVIFTGTTCDNLTAREVTHENNLTRFQAGFLPLSLRWVNKNLLPSGRVLFSAVSWEANARFAFALNPLTLTLSDYNGEEGPVPTNDKTATVDPDPSWVDVGKAYSPDYAVNMGYFAETDAFVLYSPGTGPLASSAVCRSKLDAAVPDRVVYTLDDDQFKSFVLFRAP